VLNEVLNSLNNDDSKNEFKLENGDPFVTLFAGFWNHVLKDYLLYERPIPFKKLTWKYDTKKRTQDIKDLFGDTKEKLPEEASYYFPFISDESNSKFKNFLEKIKSNSSASSQDLKGYSDIENIDLVVPITTLSNSEYTSQFTVAALEIYHYLASPLQKKLNNDNYLIEGSVPKNDACNGQFSGIPEVSIDSILSKDTKEMFCLKKGNGNNGTSNKVSDFVYLIQQQQQSWILFKDKEGIHALTYNKEATGDQQDQLEKHLINSKNFNVKKVLKNYFNKHFERLLLGYWDNFFEKNSQEQKEQKEQAKKLKVLLLRDHFAKNLVDLRKTLLKDYLDIFSEILQKKDGWFQSSLKRSFSGKFPYELFASEKPAILSNDINNFQNSMMPFLEGAYLLRNDKGSKVRWALNSFWDVKSSFDDYSSEVDKSFSKNKSKKENWDSFNFFNFSKEVLAVSSGSQKIKKIDNEDLLNSVSINLFQDSKLSEIIFQDKISSDLIDFSSWQWKVSGNLSGTTELSNLKSKEDLILEYLHLNYLELSKNLKIPQILGDFDFENNKDNKKIRESFEKINKNFKVDNGTSGHDIGKGGESLNLFAVKWLSDNGFENFRKYLRNTLKRDTLTAFVFSKKFSESEKCLPSTNDKLKIVENLELSKKSYKRYSIFRASSSSSDEKWSCLLNEESLDFAKVKVKGISEEVKHLIGYKGLVNGNWKDFFPEDIVSQLEYAFPLWKDSNSLISYIDQSIHSEDKYNELIKLLKFLFPQHNWDFDVERQCSGFSFDWKSGIRDFSCLKKSDSSFKEKKELLKQYLKQSKILDSNSSRSKLVNSGSNLLNDSLFTSKNGWFTDKGGEYLITSKDGSQYQIYLVQIKYDDVENAENWKSYLKTIDSSYFFRELIKVAKDSKIQQQALLDSLASGEGSLKNFKTGDDRLRKALGYSWFKNTKS
ncbi:hypothetical protein A6V39_05740, partial [Candidatus Mycoplasma haematobovis]